MKYVYPACFYPEEGGRYSVTVPDFALTVEGGELPDAMYAAQEAIARRIHYNFERGRGLPAPSDLRAVKPEKPEGFVSLVYVNTDLFKVIFSNATVRKTMTIPAWLNAAAERKGVNFSGTLKQALIARISD